MAIQSKYTDAQVENLLTELLTVFDKHQTPTDLRLMTLGNCVSHILQHQVNDKSKLQVAEQFSKALLHSIK